MSPEGITFNKSVLGLFGYGSWHEAIAPIEQIPFISPSDENITIQAIFIDGSVEFTVKGSLWTLLPGEEVTVEIKIPPKIPLQDAPSDIETA